jgi:hypothetical protein
MITCISCGESDLDKSTYWVWIDRKQEQGLCSKCD